jgi:hypothetical protein
MIDMKKESVLIPQNAIQVKSEEAVKPIPMKLNRKQRRIQESIARKKFKKHHGK